MSTPTLIGAARSGHRYTARYLHWGTDPQPMLELLRDIWTGTFTRDTVGMVTALLANDWTALNPAPRSRRHDDQPIPGIGLLQPGGHGLRHGCVTDDAEGWLEWMYLIDPRTDDVAVYEATCHSRWLLHSRHTLRSAQPPGPQRAETQTPHDATAEYSPFGHRWEPATITLTTPAGLVPAEVCITHHPDGMVVARITDEAAAAVAASSSPTTVTLRQSGSDFDLIWPTGAPLQEPMRLPRDEDGQLVIATPWWPWPIDAVSRATARTAGTTRRRRP